MLVSQAVSSSSQRSCCDEFRAAFWRQWEEYRDELYRCCLKWMNGNRIDAEDALSCAMLKAWEKAQKYVGEIANFKAWLIRLTHNLCIDIHREGDRKANQVENIDAIAPHEQQGLVSLYNTLVSDLEQCEKKIVIRRAINNLPTRLRETFILHFYQELSYQQIAQQQDISYQNVCKRISQARAILRKELREYFIGEDATDTDKSVTPTSTATESAIGEMSQGNAPAGARETVMLPEAVEEVESVEGEEAIEVARDVQHSESVMIESMLCERQPTPILTKTQYRILPAVGKLDQLLSQAWEILELFELPLGFSRLIALMKYFHGAVPISGYAKLFMSLPAKSNLAFAEGLEEKQSPIPCNYFIPLRSTHNDKCI